MPSDVKHTTPNSTRWEITDGPHAVIPGPPPIPGRSREEESAAWVWVLRHRRTGELKEPVVSVTWRGFDSIAEVPSTLAKEAFARAGRPGVEWFMAHRWEYWNEVIYHAQTRQPHGLHDPSGYGPIVRLEGSPGE
jgi:hypothetical protein